MWFHIIITNIEGEEFPFDVFADNLIEAGIKAELLYEEIQKEGDSNG